ncbi:MAG TPA: FHA domain-containing protein [Pirellulaceae bacterium]|nr:FHA domain-containing protein [Pirellulaceae bacterium]HMO94111.1 FHA domain-containing protein [Pirellulaceae bacterium]HMP71038.1 FHA domain-containing protein [Pirellulaceae bacterium]
MAQITLRILDGADRGRVFKNLEPPVTLGREEGNLIQLNDERVSRFHAKIQVDHDEIVLTDLESTNGTKVNGEHAQLKILRHGDTITIGRSTLLFGSREEIKARLARIQSTNSVNQHKTESSFFRKLNKLESDQESPDYQLQLFDVLPPKLPERLSPGQAAKIAEVLDFLHLKLRAIIRTSRSGGEDSQVVLSQKQWQVLLDLQTRLAEYLREIGRPSG